MGMLAGRPGAAPAAQDPLDPQIMAALRRLPTRQRQVIALRLILDLDTSGTAEVLGITPNTVMAHMARALATLRSDLTQNPNGTATLTIWSQVMSFSPTGNGPVRNPATTINPAAMPAGTELSFGNFQLPTGQKPDLVLIDTNSYTCTSTAPTAPPPGGTAFGYSGPAGS